MSADGSLRIPVKTFVLLRDATTRYWVNVFAEDAGALNEQLGSAWVYLMNADRFDGPDGNLCSGAEFQSDFSFPPFAINLEQDPETGFFFKV